MKVGIHARLLSEPSQRGWNRYTVNLLRYLPDYGIELVLYTDRPLDEVHLRELQSGSWSVRISANHRYWRWEQHWLPTQCRADRIAVLHSPVHFGLPWSAPCPQVLTLHDAIDEVFHAKRAAIWTRLDPAHVKSGLHCWIARTRADRIITVSQHARRDLTDAFGLRPSRIHVIYEAADPRFSGPPAPCLEERLRSSYGLLKPYIFYAGGYELRKNVPLLIRAMALADLQGVDLVLAGNAGEHRTVLEQLAHQLGIAARTRWLGFVPDSTLQDLYAGALCFVYPSLYEGFGLQLCEAMACGCPVLAADETSLPEVLGDGGLLFRPRADELAALLRQVALLPELRADLSRRARQRSSNFSWRECARQTAEVYRELVRERARTT